MAKKITNTNKATVAAGVGGTATAYVAGWLFTKYQIPFELSAPVVGGLFGILGRWAAKLNPNH